MNNPVLGRARPQRHPTLAGGAYRQARQQDWPRRNARRHHPRTAGMELALNLLEYVRADQRGNGNRDDFLVGLALASA